MIIVGLCKAIGDEFEFWSPECANGADIIKQSGAEIDILVQYFFAFFLFLFENIIDIGDIFDEIGHEIDFHIVLDYQEGLFINKFGI